MSWRKTTTAHPQWAISSVSNLINMILSRSCPYLWEEGLSPSLGSQWWGVRSFTLPLFSQPACKAMVLAGSSLLRVWAWKPVSIVPWLKESCALCLTAILLNRPCRQNSTRHSEFFLNVPSQTEMERSDRTGKKKNKIKHISFPFKFVSATASGPDNFCRGI